MALPAYARRVARVAAPALLRWPDKPSTAVRVVALDVSEWAGQLTGDNPNAISVTVYPVETGGLTATGPALDGTVAGCTLSAGVAGQDYAVTLTCTTPAGRSEPFTVRILVTDPTAPA